MLSSENYSVPQTVLQPIQKMKMDLCKLSDRFGQDQNLEQGLKL